MLVGALALLASSPAFATSADLKLQLSIDRASPSRALVTAKVTNAGPSIAFEPYAELWNLPGRRRFADLGPGNSTEIVWDIGTDTWLNTVRQAAALRVRYRNEDEHWGDVVVVAGLPSPADVDAPRWPQPAVLALRWTAAPAASGRIVWWRPFALGIDAPEEWRNATGGLTITGRLSPNSLITGSSVSAYALILPDRAGEAATVVEIPIDARDRGRLWRPRWSALLLWTALGLGVWFFVSRRLEDVPALAAGVVVGNVIIALFDPVLIARTTTPAGGDYASHIVGLAYLRNYLLPTGRAFGWFPDQFAGFPLMLFYFPLPFVAASLLSAVMPLTIAMKIVSLIGIGLLPVAWWLALDWLGAPRGARAIGAAASTVLLLGEWQAVWGGNVGSTMAGEFAYSLGFALAWMAVALAWRTRDDRRLSRPLVILFAATAMSHGYALVAAVSGSALLVIHTRRGPSRAWRLAVIGSAAFGLAAWWLVPFLWNVPWTVGVRGRWVVAWRDLLPPGLWLPVALTVSGVARVFWRRTRRQIESGWIWLLAFAGAMFGLYAAGYSIGVVDVRFLPFCQGTVLLLASWELARWFDVLPGRLSAGAATLAILGIVAGAAAQARAVPDWIRWNFNGIETTGPWPFYRDVMTRLAGNSGGLRVVFEHHPDLGGAGTTRAFEMIPWFSGRPTLEGLYRESALLSPATYFIQSMLTRTPSCPIEGLECGRFNPNDSFAHLARFGVDTIVTYTDTTARWLEASDAVESQGSIGPYEIFSVKQPAPIAESASYRPVVDETEDWRGDAYDWFRAGTDFDVPLVLQRRATNHESRVSRYRPGALPRQPFDGDASVHASVNGDRITIDTSAPGRPVVVKAAFHPGWRADDGSAIDMVAPGMLLVTPRSAHVELRWSAGRAGAIGVALTIAAIVALVFAHSVPLAVQAVGTRTGVVWCSVVIAAVAAAVVLAVRRHPPIDYGDVFAAGQRAANAHDFAAADRAYQRVLAASDPHHMLRDDAGLYYALSAERAGNRLEYQARLRRFLDEFPLSSFRTEVLVRLAQAYGDDHPDEVRQALTEAVSAPLGDAGWKAAAAQMLAQRSAR